MTHRTLSLSGLCILLLCSCNGRNTVTLQVDENSFHGSPVTIHKDDTVCWRNDDASDAHWPASNPHPTHTNYDGFDAKRPIKPGDTWCFTFVKTGSWSFHDHLFPAYMGTVTVE